MSILSSLNHHATLFVLSERKAFVDSLWGELRALSLVHIFHDKTVFDIDTARALISWAQTPYNGEKIALLSFHTITIPAQNALLKILEEPRAGVRFILVTTNQEALIPTLYSRLHHLEYKESFSINDLAKTFLRTAPKERMKLPSITSLLNASDEEGRKNREGVRAFIINLASILGTYNIYNLETSTTLEMASYASDPSASGKSIIEYLSLFLPQVA